MLLPSLYHCSVARGISTSHANANAAPHCHTNIHTQSHAHIFAHIYPHFYANSKSDSDAPAFHDADSDANTCSQCYTNRHLDADRFTNASFGVGCWQCVGAFGTRLRITRICRIA